MRTMKSKADVVIIGGGVNGCSLAYRLVKKGWDVVVVEKKYLSSGATGACGAGIRQQWSTRENTQLAIQSVKIFEQLHKELGQDIEFRQGGYLIAVHDEKEMKQVVDWIVDILLDPGNSRLREEVKRQVAELCRRFPIYDYMV